MSARCRTTHQIAPAISSFSPPSRESRDITSNLGSCSRVALSPVHVFSSRSRHSLGAESVCSVWGRSQWALEGRGGEGGGAPSSTFLPPLLDRAPQFRLTRPLLIPLSLSLPPTAALRSSFAPLALLDSIYLSPADPRSLFGLLFPVLARLLLRSYCFSI